MYIVKVLIIPVYVHVDVRERVLRTKAIRTMFSRTTANIPSQG